MSHPLAHDPFVATLQMYVERGTRNEHDLAQLALDIYSLVPTHPLVVNFVNEMTLKVLDQ
jgi:hypothetical protein